MQKLTILTGRTMRALKTGLLNAATSLKTGLLFVAGELKKREGRIVRLTAFGFCAALYVIVGVLAYDLAASRMHTAALDEQEAHVSYRGCASCVSMAEAR